MLFYIIISILLILIVIQIKFRKKSIIQKLNENLYDNSKHESLSKLSKLNLNRNSNDNLQYGTAEILNGNIENARPIFLDALRTNDQPDAREHIIERVHDFNAMYDLQLDNDLQHAIDNDIATITNRVEQPEEQKMETEPLINTKWQSDSQNVHDFVLSDDLNNQIQLAKGNTKINTKYEQIKKELITPENKEFFRKMDSNCILLGLNIREKELLELVYNRKNSNTTPKDVVDAVKVGIKDCFENGSVVCPTGRASKLWGSLAHVDEKYGVLKNKQVLKTDFLNKVSVIASSEDDTDKAKSQILELSKNYVEVPSIQILTQECIEAL